MKEENDPHSVQINDLSSRLDSIIEREEWSSPDHNQRRERLAVNDSKMIIERRVTPTLQDLSKPSEESRSAPQEATFSRPMAPMTEGSLPNSSLNFSNIKNMEDYADDKE